MESPTRTPRFPRDRHDGLAGAGLACAKARTGREPPRRASAQSTLNLTRAKALVRVHSIRAAGSLLWLVSDGFRSVAESAVSERLSWEQVRGSTLVRNALQQRL